jgi:hypothetical protein
VHLVSQLEKLPSVRAGHEATLDGEEGKVRAPVRTGAVRANGAAMSRSAASRAKETLPLN